MDLIVNLSVQSSRGERVRPITDVRVHDLYGKMPEEVLAELLEKLEAPVGQTYSVITHEREHWED